MKDRKERLDSSDESESESVDAGHARVWESSPTGDGALSPDNRHYLERVLRLRPDDAFQITDGAGREGDAVLLSGGRYRLSGELHAGGREPETEITLFVALIKGDRFEMVIEKAVELGVRRIVPVATARCVARPPASGKLERWRKIALAAMLQCGGCRLPEVADPVAMPNVPVPAEGVLPLVLHEARISDHWSGSGQLPRPAPVTWMFSGPEGGFTDGEVASLIAKRWHPTWLGPRRFRADTAPIAALSALILASQCR